MVFSPMETGQTVEYTPEQVISDISWTDAHPIKQVYMNCNCNTGQRMWDVMPTVQAVEGDELFFPLPDARRRCLGCSHAGENTDVQ